MTLWRMDFYRALLVSVLAKMFDKLRFPENFLSLVG